MRALLALLLFAGPLLGQAPNGWAPIENGWAEIQSTPATGTVTTTSTLVSGRVALSSGATSLTDDAGCSWTGTGASFVATFGGGVVSPLLTSGPGKSGTNVAGTNNVIQAEPGTGSAAGSDIIFQVPTPQASGSTAQVQATALTLHNAGSAGTAIPQARFAPGTGDFPGLADTSGANGFFLGNGYFTYYAGSLPRVAFDGGVQFSVGYGTMYTMSGGNAGFPDLWLGRQDAATLRLGYTDAASPVAQTLTFQGSRGGTDTNTAGVVATITGSLGTGTAAPGPIAFKVGTAQASGTTQHVAATVMTFDNVGAAGTAAPVAIAAGVIRLKGYTVATLPAGTVGDTAYVTDATAPTYLGALTGGGAVTTPVFYNGAAWVSH